MAGAMVPLISGVVSNDIFLQQAILAVFVFLVTVIIFIGARGFQVIDGEYEGLLSGNDPQHVAAHENHGIFVSSPVPSLRAVSASTSREKPLFFSLSPSRARNSHHLLSSGHDDSQRIQKPPHYYVEIVIAIITFCSIGGSVALTAYLDEFLHLKGVVTDSNATSSSRFMLLLWIFITIGRIVGVIVQPKLTRTRVLVSCIACLFLIGSFSLFLVLVSHSSNILALTAGIAGYGFGHGPCIGLLYDCNNRLTYPTEKSTSIVMFGLNLGTSLFPFFASFLMRLFGPTALILVVLVSTALPLPLLFLAFALRYKKMQNLAAPSSPSHQNYDTL